MFGNLLLWRKMMGMLWNIANFSRDIVRNRFKVPKFRNGNNLHAPQLLTTSVYHPPVPRKKLPLPLRKQCYERPNYHRAKQSRSPISWRAKAKMNEYKRITPVWPSKKRPYPTEYSPTEADSAAISTLELLRTHIKNKEKTSSSHQAVPIGNRHGSLPLYPCESQRGRTVPSVPSIVPSLWENDRYQSNRQVQELCDKLGHLTDETRMKLYPVSTVQLDAVYRRYLGHRLNVLRNCHTTENKYKKHSVNDTMLVWDTGASIGLTPFRCDFIDYLPLEGATVKDISKANKVLGIGTVMWKFKSRRGDEVFIPAVAYHMPECDIRLLSPQAYFQLHGGKADVNDEMVTMYLPGVEKHIIDIPIDKKVNLPIILQPQTTLDEQLKFGPSLLSSVVATTLQLDDIGVTTPLCCKTVADESNKNLTGPQKELLQWHWKLCTSVYHVQELMRERRYITPEKGEDLNLPPILPTKNATTRSCSVPKCLACNLSKQKLRSTGVKTTKSVKEKDGILKFNKYEPGDKVFTDQFNVHTPGRQLTGYGREGANQSLHGGTLFTDAASNYVYVECQSSMGAGETVMGKSRFEQLCWNLAGVTIKSYHSDNGVVYDATIFRNDCLAKDQSQSFSGVGAKHQNAVAERNIQTICYWARHMMVHAAVHWPNNNSDNIRLWPFAVQHAVWLFNRIPNRVTGLTPLEAFTKTKSDHTEIRRAHVWGSPVFVLDPRLQDGHKIPKWNKRSRRAQFMGYSAEHSSLVAMVRNLQTNHVSPQFHIIHDDNFETIMNGLPMDHHLSDMTIAELFDISREVYSEIEQSDDGTVTYKPPLLDDIWLDEAERRAKRIELKKDRAYERDRWKLGQEEAEMHAHDEIDSPLLLTPTDTSPPPAVNRRSNNPIVSDSDSDADDLPSEKVSSYSRNRRQASEGATLPRRSTRLRRDGRQGTMKASSMLPRTQAVYAQYTCTLGPKQPSTLSMARSTATHGTKRKYVDEVLSNEQMFFANLDWAVPDTSSLLLSSIERYLDIMGNDCGTGSLQDLQIHQVHPMILAAKSAASKEDNPTWWQAMNGPYADNYWKAAEIEIMTLEGKDSWIVTERTDDMHVLLSTWTFKLKRFPDGLVKKFKGRFCACGDKLKQWYLVILVRYIMFGDDGQ